MKIARRILVTSAITLAVIFVGVQWVLPVVLSFDAARNSPPITRIVPTDLKDTSTSEAPGKTLSYFGYEFEVPWSDLDENQTLLYPTDKPEKCRADLRFRSGLRLIVTAIPAGEWTNELATQFKVPRQSIESSFEAKSDYGFLKNLYEFTPGKMHYWALSPRIHYREHLLLTIKTAALPPSTGTGIFNLLNQSYKGFQEGNPQVRQDGIDVRLFSDQGSVEMIFSQKNYKNSAGVTQPEINRIVQSLRKAPHEGASDGERATGKGTS
ncbi:MAG TPA: hypothetical protein VN310_11300 [Candidatus Dormibacteraeota bacterium]|nr:hypothetical protein [Candidatus Dormibacteraeota bacterium]